MERRRLLLAFALLLALLVAACGGRRADRATPTASPFATLDLGDDGGGPAPGPADDADQGAAVASATAVPAPTPEGEVSEAARGEVERRLRALGLSPPTGATLVAVRDLDTRKLDVGFRVAALSPAELIDFYLAALPAAGYEINAQGESEIDFRGDGARGDIEVSAGDGGALLRLDIDER